jgi:antitoxin HicB
MELPYKISFYPANVGGFVAEIPDLPGCLTQGDNAEDVLKMIQDAKAAWIDIAIQDDIEIPEPTSEIHYSGKFNVRIPKSLHKELASKAKEENVSLNQLTTYLLSSGVNKQSGNMSSP